MTFERLDKCLKNDFWIKRFPEALVTRLPQIKLDHCPFFLSLNAKLSSNNPKPFRMESMWCNHPTFKDLVYQAVSHNNDFLYSIDTFKKEALYWYKHTFGNIFQQIRTTLARIKGIQKSVNFYHSSFFQSLEGELSDKYDGLLKVEKDLWINKFRINWLAKRDVNTNFFHSATLSIRRRNKIPSLTYDLGNVYGNQQDILEHTFLFFSISFIKRVICWHRDSEVLD